jgi:multiple sugar transport system substrate-binding protein
MHKQMSRRNFLKMVSIVTGSSAAVLAGCAPATPAAPATAAPGAVATSAPPASEAGAPVPALLRSDAGEKDYFEKAIALFESRNPTIKINRVYSPGQEPYTTKLDLMIAGGDPPAIYAPFSARGYRYYASKGLSQPLDDFITRDKVDLTDFYEDALKGCKYKGQYMALPLDAWPHLVIYNRDLFKKAGLPDVTTDWTDKTWNTDVYADYARKMTDPANNVFGARIYNINWPAGWAFGTDWFTPDVYETGIVKTWIGDTTPKTIAAVQWVADMVLKDKSATSPAQEKSLAAANQNPFTTGKVGMYLGNIGDLSTLQQVKDLNWGLAAAPFPPDGSPRHQHVWIDFWSMIKGVKNLEGAWQFLKFMVSADAQKIYPIEYGPQSSLKSLASYWVEKQKALMPTKTAQEFQTMIDAPKYEQIDLENWTINFSPINTQALQPMLDVIWLGEKTAEQAIKEATPKINQLIKDTTAGLS